MKRANRRTTMLRAYSAGGFTLVELLVVIGILIVLVALLLPTIRTSREPSRRADCSSRMRQVAMAVQAYSTANGDAIPVGIYRTSRHTGQTLLLPFLEQASLFKNGFGNSATELGATAASLPSRLSRLPIYICPSDNPSETGIPSGETNRFARSNFVLCFGSNTALNTATHRGVFRFNAPSSFATMAYDGTSNTVLVSEVITGKSTADAAGMWAYGGGGSSGYTHALPPTNIFTASDSVTGSAVDLAGAKGRASSNHSGLVNVVYADMHAANISTTIDAATWSAAGTANGGEKYEAQ